MRPLTKKDVYYLEKKGRELLNCHFLSDCMEKVGEILDERDNDVLSALKLAKKKIKNQTLTFKKDVFEILDECFQIQEQGSAKGVIDGSKVRGSHPKNHAGNKNQRIRGLQHPRKTTLLNSRRAKNNETEQNKGFGNNNYNQNKQ